MSYDSREISAASGAPIEYLQFERNGTYWRYTSAETDQTFNGNIYTALAGIERGPIEQTEEDSSMQLSITLPRTIDLAAQFIGSLSPFPVSVTLWRNHRNEAAGDAKVIWLGEVAGVTFRDSTLTLLCTTEETALGGQVGRLTFSRTCPNMLYDSLCGVVAASHTFNATVTVKADSGRTITVTGPADLGSSPSHYASGVLFTSLYVSFIISEGAAGVFTLQTPLPDLIIGQTVSLRRGCNRTASVCNSLFSNLPRFQGYAKIPLRNTWKRGA